MPQKELPTDPKSKGEGMASADAAETLSLSIIPLSSQTLRSAKLVKNARMETAVELHKDPLSGSLQISPQDLSKSLSISPRDQEIINKLSELHSYDVYSLRSGLKRLGIEVTDSEALHLSEEMRRTLHKYILELTRPMVERIFGVERAGDLSTDEGLHKILSDSDPQKVLHNLKTVTMKTGIPIDDIPRFLAEYTETLMSVAYYRYHYESIRSSIERFLFWVRELSGHREVTASPGMVRECKKAENIMRFLAGSLGERLKKFQSYFELFWSDINHNSFMQLQKQIEDNHAAMGAVLCGLSLKMKLWEQNFPDNTVGGPATRAKFVIAEMAPGLEKLCELENIARKKLGMPSVSL